MLQLHALAHTLGREVIKSVSSMGGGGILWNYTISLHVNVIRLIKINKLAPNALDHLL